MGHLARCALASLTLVGCVTAMAAGDDWVYVEPKTCTFTSSDGTNAERTVDAELTPKENSFDVTVNISANGRVLESKTYSKASAVWDGHESGMVTAAGLALTYSNWYGVIHNPVLTILAGFGDGTQRRPLTRFETGSCKR